jgi:two-component sensor histidine kinase
MKKPKRWIKKTTARIMGYYTGAFDRNSIEYWQNYIFYLIALPGVGLGTLSLVATCAVLLPRGRLGLCAALAALYAVNVGFILSRRFSLRAKALVIAAIFYLFGVLSLAAAGPLGESGIWFSVCVLLCSLFIGFRTALGFALLDFATGAGFGLAYARGLVGWDFIVGLRFSSWLLQSVNILLMDLMFAIANSVWIRGVGRTFRTLKAAEAQIQASLEEKETLIRELYHRTKNNMQVVASLLMLHAGDLDTAAAKAVFKDINDKLAAMSLVHQKLYESRDLSKIDAADYLRDLVGLLMKSYGVEEERVRIDWDLEAATMNIETAVPCGLVVSEIVSNALKHAFPDGRSGRIAVELKRDDADFFRLRIADDGVGLPAGFRVAEHGRMGMKSLFGIVTHQLHGSVEYGSAHGLEYRLRIKGRLNGERVGNAG